MKAAKNKILATLLALAMAVPFLYSAVPAYAEEADPVAEGIYSGDPFEVTAFDASESADYSVVETALANVPEDLSIYTDETTQAVQEAVNAVAYDKPASEQGEVNEMAAAIDAAVAAL